MTALPQLHEEAARAYDELDRARGAYRAVARRYLIAELLKVLGERPQIAALELNAEYEYDDEGGYFRCLSGSLTLAGEATEDDDVDDYWTEGLDVEQAVMLELFAIEDLGDGTLTRERLHALAAEGKISCPT